MKRRRIHMAVWMLIACIAIVISLFAAPSATAATRLGLHVSQEELNIWKQRMNDNVNTINGQTYKWIWDNRILPGANRFRSQSHPGGDGYWVGYTGSGCIPRNDGSATPSRTAGQNMLKSAFVYLVTGDTSYADPVKTELLNQITQPGTDFADTVKWCVENWDGSTFGPAQWVMRLLHSYDYLIAGGYTGFTNQNKIDIVHWFHAAGVWGEAKASLQVTQNLFSGARSTPSNYTCNGFSCPGSVSGTTHWQGFTTHGFHDTYSNRAANGAWMGAAAAILANDPALLNKAKLWFQEAIQFTTFPDGTLGEQNRWRDDPNTDNGAASSFGHRHGLIGPLIMIADMVARTGDVSLYAYSTSNGQFGTSGGPKSLQTIIVHEARLVNGTLAQYGTNNGTQTAATLLNHLHDNGKSEDWADMMPNIYYQNSEVRTAMMRIQTPGSSCGGNGCYGWPNASLPDTPFMFSNLDSGQVNPYTLGSSMPTPPYVTPTIYCLGACPTLPVSPTSSIPPPSSFPLTTYPSGIAIPSNIPLPTTIQQNPSPTPPPPGGKNLIELLLEFLRSILELLLKLLRLGQ